MVFGSSSHLAPKYLVSTTRGEKFSVLLITLKVQFKSYFLELKSSDRTDWEIGNQTKDKCFSGRLCDKNALHSNLSQVQIFNIFQFFIQIMRHLRAMAITGLLRSSKRYSICPCNSITLQQRHLLVYCIPRINY